MPFISAQNPDAASQVSLLAVKTKTDNLPAAPSDIVQADIISDATPFAGANVADIKAVVDTLPLLTLINTNVVLAINATYTPAVGSFIATAFLSGNTSGNLQVFVGGQTVFGTAAFVAGAFGEIVFGLIGCNGSDPRFKNATGAQNTLSVIGFTLS